MFIDMAMLVESQVRVKCGISVVSLLSRLRAASYQDPYHTGLGLVVLCLTYSIDF